MSGYKNTSQVPVLSTAKKAFSILRSGRVAAGFESQCYAVKSYVRSCHAS